MCLPVLLVGLHFLHQPLLGHLDEIVVFLNGFLDDLPLVLPFPRQVLQELSFLVLNPKGNTGYQKRRGTSRCRFLGQLLYSQAPENPNSSKSCLAQLPSWIFYIFASDLLHNVIITQQRPLLWDQFLFIVLCNYAENIISLLRSKSHFVQGALILGKCTA